MPVLMVTFFGVVFDDALLIVVLVVRVLLFERDVVVPVLLEADSHEDDVVRGVLVEPALGDVVLEDAAAEAQSVDKGTHSRLRT